MIAIEWSHCSDRVICAVDVDEDSFLVTCLLSHPDHSPPSPNRADLIDKAFGIGQATRLLMIGDIDFVLRPSGQIESFDWRPGPSVLRCGLVPLVEDAAKASIRFMVDWPGDDDRVTIDAPTNGVFDPTTRTLRLVVGIDAEKWVRLADTVLCAVSASGEFAGIQIENVPVDLCIKVGCN